MKFLQRCFAIATLLCALPCMLYAEEAKSTEAGFDMMSLVVPALLAALGYLGTSVYDIYMGNRKRKRELLESKLQLFYWPIAIRLKKNENVYRDLFEGKNDKNVNSADHVVAMYVEKNVLVKNHQEIMDIITQYRHLAETDEQFEDLINKFIRHATIYKALIDADINEYPGVVKEARYPSGIDGYFYKKTAELQTQLQDMKF